MDQQLGQLSLENQEKRDRAASELQVNPARSDRLIAREAAISQSTVYRVRKELEAAGMIKPVDFNARSRKPMVRRLLVEKLELLHQELIKDPRRSNRLLGHFVGISPDTVRLERDKLEAAGTIQSVDPKERMNSAGRPGHGGGVGGHIDLPPGATVMGLAAKGIEAENANPGMTMDDVSTLIGINIKTYRHARAVYLLSQRDDLTKTDRETVRKAVADIEATKQISRFWPSVAPIAERIWGKPTGGSTALSGGGNEKRRKQSFDHAVGLIFDMCSRGPEVEVPYLAETEQVDALHRVNEAISCLKKLSTNIRRARG